MKTTSYHSPQPGDFAFDEASEAQARKIVARYPDDRKASATIALLDLAQRQNGGWLSRECIEYVAQYLDIAPIRAYEVASFYTMFYLEPVGRHLIQVCRTTPCWLRGSDEITKTSVEQTGCGRLGGTSEDGLFTVIEVECLGACCNAPMVQINDWYYEDLTPESMAQIIADLKAGKEVERGSQAGRLASAPEGGPHTLLDTLDGGGAGE
jgi:NADH-quinone oxidoreductase subunit E